MNIQKEKVKFHTWNIAVFFSPYLMDIFSVCKKISMWVSHYVSKKCIYVLNISVATIEIFIS